MHVEVFLQQFFLLQDGCVSTAMLRYINDHKQSPRNCTFQPNLAWAQPELQLKSKRGLVQS